jgi:SRSO17 transposase
VVLADAGYGEVTEFRDGLETRQLAYAVGIPSRLGVWTHPPRAHKGKARGRGRPPRVYH